MIKKIKIGNLKQERFDELLDFGINLAAKEFVRQVAENSLDIDLETVYID